jgi:4a-hydroxytetrahydrobiopterin dehydratase
MNDDDTTKLARSEVAAEGLVDWRVMLNALHARFETGSFMAGLALATAIAHAAEEANHHPDLDLRYPHLNVTLTSHDVGGVTQRDVRMARRISALAASQGAPANPSAVQVLEIALDTLDRSATRPFWKAVLGLGDSRSNDNDIVDAGGSLPALWFQDTDSSQPDRQRFHLDITVPPEVARDRIAAALEAGGTLVSEDAAPAFVVLADAEGNQVCVCTSEGRD